MARLYHPELGREIEVSDDAEGYIALLGESGWEKAPEPETRPGYEPEPVTYAPVTPKTAKRSKTEPHKGEESTN